MDVPTGFDAVLHPPARLQIAAVLAQAQDAEFALLKEITGASDSVMSKHLSALAEAGYVTLRKAATGGRQRHMGEPYRQAGELRSGATSKRWKHSPRVS